MEGAGKHPLTAIGGGSYTAASYLHYLELLKFGDEKIAFKLREEAALLVAGACSAAAMHGRLFRVVRAFDTFLKTAVTEGWNGFGVVNDTLEAEFSSSSEIMNFKDAAEFAEMIAEGNKDGESEAYKILVGLSRHGIDPGEPLMVESQSSPTVHRLLSYGGTKGFKYVTLERRVTYFIRQGTMLYKWTTTTREETVISGRSDDLEGNSPVDAAPPDLQEDSKLEG